MRPKPSGRMRQGMRKGMRRAVVSCGKRNSRSIWPQPYQAMTAVRQKKRVSTTIQLMSCQRLGNLSYRMPTRMDERLRMATLTAR